jgi:hypothetical protein
LSKEKGSFSKERPDEDEKTSSKEEDLSNKQSFNWDNDDDNATLLARTENFRIDSTVASKISEQADPLNKEQEAIATLSIISQ